MSIMHASEFSLAVYCQVHTYVRRYARTHSHARTLVYVYITGNNFEREILQPISLNNGLAILRGECNILL
jgi:hypothetical protein